MPCINTETLLEKKVKVDITRRQLLWRRQKLVLARINPKTLTFRENLHYNCFQEIIITSHSTLEIASLGTKNNNEKEQERELDGYVTAASASACSSSLLHLLSGQVDEAHTSILIFTWLSFFNYCHKLSSSLFDLWHFYPLGHLASTYRYSQINNWWHSSSWAETSPQLSWFWRFRSDIISSLLLRSSSVNHLFHHSPKARAIYSALGVYYGKGTLLAGRE